MHTKNLLSVVKHPCTWIVAFLELGLVLGFIVEIHVGEVNLIEGILLFLLASFFIVAGFGLLIVDDIKNYRKKRNKTIIERRCKMKKLKLLARESFFWIPIVLMLMLILTVEMIVSIDEKIDWGFIVGVFILGFLASGVMLAIAIDSVNEKLRVEQKRNQKFRSE